MTLMTHDSRPPAPSPFTPSRVGNALGAGRAAAAKLAALAAAASAPVLWVAVAVILVNPTCQHLLLALFTSKAGDELLLQRMRNLLYLVVVLELFDGAQTGEVECGAGAGFDMGWVLQHMSNKLYVEVVLELFDGAQMGERTWDGAGVGARRDGAGQGGVGAGEGQPSK